jgi:sugar lactone lactonase YvrE
MQIWQWLRRIGVGLIGVALIGIVVFVLLPSPIDAVYWQPPQPPQLVGPLEPNTALEEAELVSTGIAAPEDLAFDAAGNLYTGSLDGTIYRIVMGSDGQVERTERFVHTGGYPLGLHFDADSNLIAAVKDIGLLSIAPDGTIDILVDEANSIPVRYADELDIAGDGTIYFSDASTKYQWGWLYDYLEGRPNGRLIAFFPETGQAEVLLDGLYFPNGILLAPDESFLLITESFRYHIRRYWLSGERAGTSEVITENTPNVPDNLAIDDNGVVWVGGSLRSSLIDSLQRYPFLRNQLAKLGEQRLRDLQGAVQPYGFMMTIDLEGNILGSYHAPSGHVFGLSSAQPHNNSVYLGTVVRDFIARIPHPDSVTVLPP